MKKVLCLMMVTVMAIALVACGGSKKSDDKKSKTNDTKVTTKTSDITETNDIAETKDIAETSKISDSKGLTNSDIEGKYDFVEMKQGKQSYKYKELKDMGITMTLEIKSDGSGEFKQDKTVVKLKFDVDKMRVKGGNETDTFTYDAGVLVIKNKDASMKFKKK